MSKQEIIEEASRAIAEDWLIVDTETTGLEEDDQIVEIAIVDALGTFEFSALVKSPKAIPPRLTEIHGITNEMIERAADPDNLWPLVHQIICGSAILAYNAAFDSRLVVQTFGPEARDHEWHCLMNAWMGFHGLGRWKKLELVCADIGVPAGGHRALGDAKAAREVLRWLAKQEV